MKNRKHLTKVQLIQLLDGDGELNRSSEISQHLKACDDCQRKLNSLAAKQDIWSKLTEYLQRSNVIDSHSLIRSKLEIASLNEANRLPNEPSGENVPWQFSPEDWLDPPRHPELIGRIGRYDIEREVGRGGMGIVFKAFDNELHRPLAIKFLAPHLATHGTARKRFAQEAVAAAGIIHPNVIAVHGVNHQSKLPYIVMPFVDGVSLQSLVDSNGPLPEIETIRVAQQIAAGLTAAHSQGLVHRDIKPANILVEADVNRVLITDFGLARAEDDASLTQTGFLTGTPNYMSPEQAQGQRPDHRSDLFSLGSLIYFMTTGRLPFRAETPLGVLARIQNETPTSVRQLNKEASETLASLIQRLLEKDPNVRFQSAAELHEVLTKHLAFLHQPDVNAPPLIECPPSANARESEKENPPQRDIHFWLVPLLLVGIVTLTYFLGIHNRLFSNNDQRQKHQTNTQQKGDSHLHPRSIASPQKGILLIKIGNDYLKLEKYEDAIKSYQEAEAYPWCSSAAYYHLGCVWALKGDQEQSLEFLSKAIDRGFVDPAALQSPDLNSVRNEPRFIDLLVRNDEMKLAVQLIEEEPRKTSATDWKRAESTFRAALDRDVNNEEATVSLSYLIHAQGRYSEALDWHQRTVNTQKYVPIGHYNLCCHYSIHDDPDKAFEELSKAVETGLAHLLQPEKLQQDSDLDPIRSDQRYQKILVRFEQKFAELK